MSPNYLDGGQSVIYLLYNKRILWILYCPQFEDAPIEEEEDEEQVVIESVTEEELEQPVAGKLLIQEFDEINCRNCKARRDTNSRWGGRTVKHVTASKRVPPHMCNLQE